MSWRKEKKRLKPCCGAGRCNDLPSPQSGLVSIFTDPLVKPEMVIHLDDLILS